MITLSQVTFVSNRPFASRIRLRKDLLINQKQTRKKIYVRIIRNDTVLSFYHYFSISVCELMFYTNVFPVHLSI